MGEGGGGGREEKLLRTVPPGFSPDSPNPAGPARQDFEWRGSSVFYNLKQQGSANKNGEPGSTRDYCNYLRWPSSWLI